MSEFEVFRSGFPSFYREVNNYRLYLEKCLSKGVIPKNSALYQATRLLQIQLVNLNRQLALVERILD